MTDNLVKRFVEQLRHTGGEAGVQCEDCLPLADAIEGLTAERDRLKLDVVQFRRANDGLQDMLSQSKEVGFAFDNLTEITAERDGLLRCVTDNHVALCRAEKAEAERDRLREALDGLLTSVEHADFEDGWCCCGDDMLHHQSPMDCGHTPVDMGEYHASLAIKKARAALKGETT